MMDRVDMASVEPISEPEDGSLYTLIGRKQTIRSTGG